MKRSLKWVVIALVVLLLAFGILRALSARKAQQQAVAQAAATKTQAMVELAATDIVSAQTRVLAQGLPISGTLKAANSAVVKARVAGELQGLTVREGDPVKAGQVIARIDPTEYQARVKQAQEQADSAKAQIDIAQRQWDNNKALVDQGFISKTALDTSWNNLTAAQSTHKAALAAVDMARKSMDDTVLRSPITGQVSQRVAQPGERVGVDTKVVEVVDLSRIEMEAALSPADSVQVRVGQVASLQIEGVAQPLAARVVRINPSTQTGSRNVLAYLSIEKPEGLRQGLFAQGTLAGARISALSVPVSAVRTDKPNPYVQVVENNTVVHKPVELGARGDAGGETVVEVKGVAENAVVVSGALGTLREGTAVRFTQMPAGGTPAPTAAPAAAALPASAAKTAP
jgi:RND family efflux transporter MFP subunit